MNRLHITRLLSLKFKARVMTDDIIELEDKLYRDNAMFPVELSSDMVDLVRLSSELEEKITEIYKKQTDE